MFTSFWWRVLKLFSVFLLFLFVALIGDALLRLQKVRGSFILRAGIDNGTHFLLGAMSWAAIASFQPLSRERFLEIILCGFLASIIDVDHFVAAKSFRLKDALHLDRRPLLHNTFITTAPNVIFIIVMHAANFQWLKRVGFMLLVAVMSHHLRDSLRRGLWLGPFGTTPALNFLTYIILSCAVPLVSYACISTMKTSYGDEYELV